MLSNDAENFFQSDRDLQLQQKRNDKKESVGASAGDPKTMPSKIIDIEFVDALGQSALAFLAESGFVARKVDMSVCIVAVIN